mgnify:CR=1 FL=1
MSMYTKYLICYDVDNDRNRKKLFKFLKDLGLVPIQLSVFYGDLNQAEFNSLKNYVFMTLDKDSDKVIWIKCNLKSENINACFGYSNFKYLEPDAYETI